jgi:MoaA/NifB/PqqE/SkfB family radical SAM enzyme
MPAHYDLRDKAISSATEGQSSPYAIQGSHLLILLLLSRCNNRCRFCMVDDEIETSVDLPLEIGRQLIEDQSPETRIEFFGGEPTIHPHFWELLTLARKRGFNCSIATNGRTFASKKFAGRMASLDAGKIYVRTSLYGPDSEIHDYYTRSPGSFEQTVRGVQHLVQYDFMSQINIVIMNRNANYLTRMVDLVSDLGVPRIKFGMLVDSEKNLSHLVRLAQLRKPLNQAVERALRSGLRVTIEKTPMCLAPSFVSHFTCERQIAPVDRAYAFDGPCGRCVVARWCPGVDPYYLKCFGAEELLPLRSLPADQIHSPDINSLRTFEPEIFKVHFIALQPAWMQDRKALRRLAALENRIAENLGEIALVPLELIKQN